MFKRFVCSLFFVICLLVTFSSVLAEETDTRKGLLSTFKEWNNLPSDEPLFDVNDSDDYYAFDGDISFFTIDDEDISGESLYINMNGFLEIDYSSSSINYGNASSIFRSPITLDASQSGSYYNLLDVSSIKFRDALSYSYRGTDTTVFIDRGDSVIFNFSNIESYLYVDATSKPTGETLEVLYFYMNSFNDLIVQGKDINGNWLDLSISNLSHSFNSTGSLSVSFTVDPVDVDIYSFRMFLETDLDNYDFDYSLTESYTYRYYLFKKHFLLNGSECHVELVDKQEGFWSGVISWLSAIKDSILNLPSLILDGISSLFIPESDFFDGYVDKWDIFFSEHFGFIYTAINTIVDIFNTIIDGFSSESSGVIAFPEISYDFGDGAVFSFGGFDVDIVPDGFESIVSILKRVVNIILTLAFVNMGYRKLQSILEGGD